MARMLRGRSAAVGSMWLEWSVDDITEPSVQCAMMQCVLSAPRFWAIASCRWPQQAPERSVRSREE
ncbi:hypothetical protein CGK74_07825 [Thauera propionica]|uniref:Uncharacterized protein n=1 Tax=Thauera propionica TaxID=2019431 RepID=A0A235F039_9RHOO|nr:hypothetical protein CGK74_07825 [Thauera propionica]